MTPHLQIRSRAGSQAATPTPSTEPPAITGERALAPEDDAWADELRAWKRVSECARGNGSCQG